MRRPTSVSLRPLDRLSPEPVASSSVPSTMSAASSATSKPSTAEGIVSSRRDVSSSSSSRNAPKSAREQVYGSHADLVSIPQPILSSRKTLS
eukprot:GILI01005166.1.p1 GENE.GILI01005166.1~~GILI01005166.1.p1  ORF type:complete len:106 (+),score=26.77 GILI01005166.1:43-318(+)